VEVYLIRHTTPEVAKGICYGRTDLPVREPAFAGELASIRQFLPDGIVDWYSSPLQRCRVLTEALTDRYLTDDRLQELDFGTWEGCRWDAIDRPALDAWSEDFVYAAPPQGESFHSLHLRTRPLMYELLEKQLERVAIVTHAGNIRSTICHALGLPLEHAFRITVGYGSVTHLRLLADERMNQLVSLSQSRDSLL
jgi:alpha-ribazole phosphatase